MVIQFMFQNCRVNPTAIGSTGVYDLCNMSVIISGAHLSSVNIVPLTFLSDNIPVVLLTYNSIIMGESTCSILINRFRSNALV